jgi:hypothetical protein
MLIIEWVGVGGAGQRSLILAVVILGVSPGVLATTVRSRQLLGTA